MPQRKESRTPTPTTENVETTLVVTPTIEEDKKSVGLKEHIESEGSSDENNEKYLKSSTHNKENENNENKKTEPPPPLAGDGIDAPTSSPDVTVKVPLSQTASQRAQTSDRIRAAFFNPLPLVTQITTNTTPKVIQTTAAASSPTTTTTTPTLDSPVRLRDKRSLFDLDNASSQTLADKLRSEANKYSYDEKRGAIFAGETSSTPHDSSIERDTSASPITGVGYNYNSRRSLDSSSLPSSPLHTRDRETGGGGGGGGSDTSSTASTVTSGGSVNNILYADRRPSWRLKFDTGSKV